VVGCFPAPHQDDCSVSTIVCPQDPAGPAVSPTCRRPPSSSGGQVARRGVGGPSSDKATSRRSYCAMFHEHIGRALNRGSAGSLVARSFVLPTGGSCRAIRSFAPPSLPTIEWGFALALENSRSRRQPPPSTCRCRTAIWGTNRRPPGSRECRRAFPPASDDEQHPLFLARRRLDCGACQAHQYPLFRPARPGKSMKFASTLVLRRLRHASRRVLARLAQRDPCPATELCPMRRSRSLPAA